MLRCNLLCVKLSIQFSLQKSQSQQCPALQWSIGEAALSPESDWFSPPSRGTFSHTLLLIRHQQHSLPAIINSLKFCLIAFLFSHCFILSLSAWIVTTCWTFCPLVTHSFPTLTLGWHRPLMRSAEFRPIRYADLSASVNQDSLHKAWLKYSYSQRWCHLNFLQASIPYLQSHQLLLVPHAASA